MPGTPPQPNHAQATLLPPEAVEIVVKIGLVGPTGHGQWQLEITNATDGVLLAMKAKPHFDVRFRERELAVIAGQLRLAIAEYLLPF